MPFDSQTSAQSIEVEVLIIGAGFSGLCMGTKLKQAGMNDFVILDRGQEIGGTWRDNHYPGCACDVQSHLYSFSFEPNPNWSRMFAPQAEIKAYLQHCAEKYALLPHIRLGAELLSVDFDESGDRWHAVASDGSRYTARVVVSGMGALSRPAYPKVAGIERFAGHKFHSADWDHDYDLNGKKVAVIGTGASAIQFVPAIAPQVQHLDLYQRTPPWIVPKPDRKTAALERVLYRRFPALQRLFRELIYWILELRVLGFVINPKLMEFASRRAVKHIARQIPDPALRAKLTPDYMFGCKRVLISDNYYPALARANVDVVTEGIREVTAGGVVTADGVERPADAIIFGTGFQAQDPIPRGMIHGRGGIDLHEAWPQGPEAYLGVSVARFPNLFLLLGPNTGLAHNSMIYMIECQVGYVMSCLKAMREKSWSRMEVRPEVQVAYNELLQKRLEKSIWNSGGCHSWYLNERGRNTLLWPGFTFSYGRLMRHFNPGDFDCASRREPAVS